MTLNVFRINSEVGRDDVHHTRLFNFLVECVHHLSGRFYRNDLAAFLGKIFSQKTCATTEIQNIGRNIQLQRMKCLLRILSDTLIFVPLSRAIVPLFLGYGHNRLSSAVAGPPSLPWPKYPVTSQFD
jgi:hypothetical protein